MALRPERLDGLLEEVAQERLSLRSGSPSDAEIGREKLADLAQYYLPELIHAYRAQAAALADAEARPNSGTLWLWSQRLFQVAQELRAACLPPAIGLTQRELMDYAEQLEDLLKEVMEPIPAIVKAATTALPPGTPPEMVARAQHAVDTAKANRAARCCHECGNDYWANCLTCREEVGEPTVTLAAPATCKCNLTQKVVGDGCQVCNPEMAAYYAQEAATEDAPAAPVAGSSAGQPEKEGKVGKRGRSGEPGTHRVTVWPIHNGEPTKQPAFIGRSNTAEKAQHVFRAITFANAKGLAEVSAPAYLLALERIDSTGWMRTQSRTVRLTAHDK